MAVPKTRTELHRQQGAAAETESIDILQLAVEPQMDVDDLSIFLGISFTFR